jgi:hypothetical protein
MFYGSGGINPDIPGLFQKRADLCKKIGIVIHKQNRDHLASPKKKLPRIHSYQVKG